MASRLGEVVRNPNSIGALFRKDYGSMERYFRLASLIHARTASKRVAAAQKLGPSELRIPETVGFLRVSTTQDPLSLSAIKRASEILAAHNLEALEQTAKKQFLIQIKLDPSKEWHWPIFEFAFSSQIVDPIASYLGILPILTGAHVWYSPNKVFEGRSQEFHLDGADAKQIKLFLFLDDIDENSGPLTGLSADASRKIYGMLRHKGMMDRVNVKIPDPVIFELLKEISSEPIAFTGKAGDMVFVDTCRCMHFGSRPSKKGKNKARKVIMLHYTRPYAPDLPLFGSLAKAPALLGSKSEKERQRLEYLLGVRR